MPNYIFYHDNKAKFTFTDNNDKKVLEYIENNLFDYYDERYNTREDKFKLLKRATREKGIVQALFDDAFINATVEEINPITKI